MAVRTFGTVKYKKDENELHVFNVEPHVSIKLKNVFQQIRKSAVEYFFSVNPDNCNDLKWFLQRYPMKIDSGTKKILEDGVKDYHEREVSFLHMDSKKYKPKPVQLRDGTAARDYQISGRDFHLTQKRLLLGDDLGLGKTLTAILTFGKGTLPAMVVVQTHLKLQWQREISKFTELSVHIIKGRKPYQLPVADVYIISYSCITKWVEVIYKLKPKEVIYDEVQELRRAESDKYQSAKTINEICSYCLGMSATPVYNYGDEMYNILNSLNPFCLGNREDFLREWCVPKGNNHYLVKDPQAFGAYLREKHLFLRRTREDVKRELPALNKIVYTVDYDEHQVDNSIAIAKMLAIQATSGSFVERGQAARELDVMLRQITGVSKAKSVADWVKIFLSSGEPIVLAGWHREVYKIWERELASFNPVFYTGTESPIQKDLAVKKFLNEETNLFIMSLRSGVGLDGLQQRCKTAVVGELDWSPKVHDQFFGRLDRDGRNVPQQVTGIYLVSDFGSDPVIMDLLGLKSAQAFGISDPFSSPKEQFSDETNLQALAKRFLEKINPT